MDKILNELIEFLNEVGYIVNFICWRFMLGIVIYDDGLYIVKFLDSFIFCEC